MKPSPFEYHCPHSLGEALDLLAKLENTKVLAGGQSLMPMLSMRYVIPDHVIDLNRIETLAYIREDRGHVAIGSMTRQRDIELSPVIRERLPILVEALRFVGHVPTRNRGTIGGSLCHLDPAAELPALAMAHDAEIAVASPHGQRTIPIAQFAASYMAPQLNSDEVVTEVRFPVWPVGQAVAFEEFARRHGDFATVAVVVLLSMASDRTINRASITLAGVGAKPLRITNAEDLLVGQRLEKHLLARAAAICGEIDALEDCFASSAYRCHLATTLTSRAFKRVAACLSPEG